ncbi:Lysophospholipase VolA [Paraglaciecola mesophila]|uniref:Lysophospholipase VolA n=1 Tax=Paraglaciecola mesophila TaxID=197222 RepID=A0A857JGX7_9ALTE|nr:VolA/Pla-1 family phospholipase [Paraglaciecola mesophila]QHJ10177.1 Lysophospholipase VolA [Paraglaciecola mesophila]
MNKLLLSASIAAVLGLTGCNGDSVADLETDNPVEKPFARVVFDPANSDLNLPNDLLMLPSGSFFDFTLNTEGTETFDGGNPEHALSALDGWSTQNPFSIRVTLPTGLDIDASSVNGSSIKLFQATQALEGTSETCQAIAAAAAAPGVPCELGDELVYGEDFVASYESGAGTGSITVIPLKPLAAGQGHMLVVTDSLLDTDGKSIKGSSSWELARQDIRTLPLSTEEQLQLQTLVNSIVDVIIPTGIEREAISYASYFSTVSAGSVMDSVKNLQIAGYATAFGAAMTATGGDAATSASVARDYLPQLNVSGDNVSNAYEALGSQLGDTYTALQAQGLGTCAGLYAALEASAGSPSAELTQAVTFAGPFCAAKRIEAEVKLPYYLSTTNPLGDWWRAMCTSGATLQLMGAETVTSLIQGGAVGPNDALCQQASGGQLRDLDLSSLGIDDPRNLTKFNPLPIPQGTNTDDDSTLINEAGTETLGVQFTVPDESVIAMLSAATNGAIPLQTKPDNGWPVIIVQHGITGAKENALVVAAAFSLAGFATVAIDHPLHGGRGFTLADGTVVNASTHSPTDYMNLASLITARDNLRQSAADTLGLRLALNAINDGSGVVDIDTSEVHFIAQSLGSISGMNTLANANTPFEGDFAPFSDMYKVDTAVLNVPSGGVANFLLESPDFGPLIKGSLLAASSEDFATFLAQYAEANALSIEAAIRPAYVAFDEALEDDARAEIAATFSQFVFAAQTILDAGDPINYAQQMAGNTPTLMQLVVGGGVNDDGTTALTDQVNPVVTALPLSGGIPLSQVMGLSQVSSTTESDATQSGVVYFSAGAHQSLFVPTPSVSATLEMQNQAVEYFGSDGQNIVIADESVVAN